jgi:hypothetical protein
VVWLGSTIFFPCYCFAHRCRLQSRTNALTFGIPSTSDRTIKDPPTRCG